MLETHWTLDPEVTFLNHGSFGAAPRVVLEEQRQWRDLLERGPVEFLAPERSLEGRLDHVRTVLSTQFGCRFDDLAFVRNATDGVNAVLRSLPLDEENEVVITSHGYGACSNAVRYVVERMGGRVLVADLPFPVRSPGEILDAIKAATTDWTRLIVVDHVTSATGLILPIEEIVEYAHGHGIRVLVDGAHAPGMVPLNLEKIGADYYTGNLHKWICAPKAAGFLHVKEEHQHEVRPTVISHAAGTPRPGRSRFHAEFDWTGTFDPSPLLSVPKAIEFLGSVVTGGLGEVMRANHDLVMTGANIVLEALGAEPQAPESMIGSLATLPLPDGAPVTDGGIDPLQRTLVNDYKIEVPVVHWPKPGKRWIRLSAQLYNRVSDYEKLAGALRAELSVVAG